MNIFIRTPPHSLTAILLPPGMETQLDYDFRFFFSFLLFLNNYILNTRQMLVAVKLIAGFRRMECRTEAHYFDILIIEVRSGRIAQLWIESFQAAGLLYD